MTGEKCPILKLCKSNKSNLVPWNLCKGSNRIEKDIMLMREDHQLFNGITISTQIGGVKELVGWASDERKYDISKVVIENLDTFYKCILKLRKAAFNSNPVKFDVKLINPTITTTVN
ncbi:hypothetical protein NOVO_05445 [Rickettsiales bacterium Ac37b]|nr:hypothetical protein NOVO_05445 [Rickettsiales bacterium Ac37b]